MRLRFSWQQDSYMIFWVMTLCSLVGGYHSFGWVGRIEREENLLFLFSNLEQSFCKFCIYHLHLNNVQSIKID